MLNALRRNALRRQIAEQLEAQIAARARAPVFFAGFAVPDTIDGRFDMLALHAALVLEKIAASGDRALAQALMDTIFVSFDESLRQLGAGDVGMGRKMKKIASAFLGRARAYGDAQGETAMQDAILRNIYRGNPNGGARILAAYAVRARARLSQCDLTTLDFGPLPSVTEDEVMPG